MTGSDFLLCARPICLCSACSALKKGPDPHWISFPKIALGRAHLYSCNSSSSITWVSVLPSGGYKGVKLSSFVRLSRDKNTAESLVNKAHITTIISGSKSLCKPCHKDAIQFIFKLRKILCKEWSWPKVLGKIISESHFCEEKWHRYRRETQRKEEGISSDLSTWTKFTDYILDISAYFKIKLTTQFSPCFLYWHLVALKKFP